MIQELITVIVRRFRGGDPPKRSDLSCVLCRLDVPRRRVDGGRYLHDAEAGRSPQYCTRAE